MQWTSGLAWQHSLWRLTAALAAATVTGALLGHALVGLTLGLFAALCWHYAQLWRLLSQLRSRARFPAPEGRGVFAEVGELIYRRDRESRRRRQRLRGLLRSFRAAASALPDAVVVLNRADLRIEAFNAAATRLLGLRHPIDFGKRFNHIVRAPRVVEWLDRADGELLLDQASPLDASIRLSLRLIAYTDAQWLLIARDISTLMRLEHMRRDFVANVSHELRTPLTVLHGYLDLLEPADCGASAVPIAEMQRQSKRMMQIVGDLLLLSRLDAQERAPLDRVRLAPLLNALLQDAQRLSAGRQTIELDDRSQADLLGAEPELHSAFSNLLSNAVRYTPAGGQIVLRVVDEQDGGLCLSVGDNGPGIPAQHLPRITERFYRVSASRSRDSGGTGLGLAIVKHALGLHEAKLEIRSEPGRGSTFCCRFDATRVLPRTGA